MTYDERYFQNINKSCNGFVRLADEKELIVKGIGTVVFKARVENVVKDIKLNNTLWIPGLKTSLISASKATDNECTVKGRSGRKKSRWSLLVNTIQESSSKR